jgi:hypothetical protein
VEQRGSRTGLFGIVPASLMLGLNEATALVSKELIDTNSF